MLGERLEMHAERLAAALDLTDAQRASFEALREQHLAAVRPKHEQMRAAHQALRELLEAASPDAAAVGAEAIEIHRLRGELAALRERFDSDFRATLTEAQRLALDAVRETRPGHGMRGRFGSGPGGPGPWGAPPDAG
jgi:Spy/CpxP family protein refolding chaperone